MDNSAHLESTLERLIVENLSSQGWNIGVHSNFNLKLGLDTLEVEAFVIDTQPESWAKLIALHGSAENARTKFFHRLASEIDSRGTIDVLRKGLVDMGVKIDLAYFAPANQLTPENLARFNANRLTVTRQIRMSETNPNDSIDLVFFLNGVTVLEGHNDAR